MSWWSSRGRVRRASVALAAVTAAVLGLTGCFPIEVTPEGTMSRAAWEVVPGRTVVDGQRTPTIQIRYENCHTLRLSSPEATIERTLRPAATVTDAAGTTILSNFSGASGAFDGPRGTVIDTAPDIDTITIPVARGSGPFEVSAGCTDYTGAGSSMYYLWQFEPCTTDHRRCPHVAGGSGAFGP